VVQARLSAFLACEVTETRKTVGWRDQSRTVVPPERSGNDIDCDGVGREIERHYGGPGKVQRPAHEVGAERAERRHALASPVQGSVEIDVERAVEVCEPRDR